MPRTRHAALADLLLTLFGATTLRRFVASGPAAEITAELPGKRASPADLADAVVVLLEQRGLVDGTFWDELIAERPRRRAEIERVRALWAENTTLLPGGVSATPATPAPLTSPIPPTPPSHGRTPGRPASTRRTILFLSANPDPASPLAVDREYRRIATRLESTAHRDDLELICWPDVHPGDLPTRLRRARPTLVHFSGHGRPDGSLLMRGETGDPIPVAPDAVAGFLTRRSDTLRLVVLSACYSRHLADRLRDHIDCTIGMDTTVTDEAAAIFGETLYEALFDGETFPTAFADSRDALAAAGTTEATTPRMTLKPGLPPDQQRLFAARQ